MSSFVPPGITGKICLKSPPHKIDFPPNGLSLGKSLPFVRTSRSERSNASKQHRLFIGASSYTIREVISRSRARSVFFLISHDEVSETVRGILNLE